jgi:hypothetical protein
MLEMQPFIRSIGAFLQPKFGKRFFNKKGCEGEFSEVFERVF